MIRKFEYLQMPDIARMHGIIADMQALLEALDQGLVPNRSDYSHDELRGYLCLTD